MDNYLVIFKYCAGTSAKSNTLKRNRLLLPLLLLFFCLSLIFPGQVPAKDGALDPSFIIGPGPYAGVQVLPVIRGAVDYPNLTGAPFNGYTLLFGTFWGIQYGGTPTSGNQCIARLTPTPTRTLDTTFVNNQINGEILGVFIYRNDYPVASLRNKILIWGRFNASAGASQYVNLARLNADGSLDTTFPMLNSYNGAVNAVAPQGPGFYGGADPSNDKFLVGGYNLHAGPNDNGPVYQLVRLNYDGSPDHTFTHWGAPNGYVNGIRVYYNDPLFANNVRLFLTYPKNPDGSGGKYYMLLLDPSVTIPDAGHPPIVFIGDETVDGAIFNIARQSLDGKFLICGQFKNVFNTATSSWVPRSRVARLGVDCKTLDPSYDVGVGPNSSVSGIVPMMANSPYDDRMLVGGFFNTWNGAPCGSITRLQTDGSVDPTFTTGTRADDRITRLNWFANGSGGLVSGSFRSYSGEIRGGITGLNADGSPNTGYSSVTALAGWPGMVYSVATQADGKILIGGDFNGVGGKSHVGFARLNPDGSLDNSLRGTVDGIVKSIAVQPDGNILLGGAFGMCQAYACTGLARMGPDGAFDKTFNPLLVGDNNRVSQINHVVPLANGQIMIAGDISTPTAGSSPVARLKSDGSLDNAFFANTQFELDLPDDPWAWGNRVAVVGDKFLVGGVLGIDGYDYYNYRGFLISLNNNGTLDTGFATGASVPNIQQLDGRVSDLLLQKDGKILVSGSFTHADYGSPSPPARLAIARFTANGDLDNTFAFVLNTWPTDTNALLVPAMGLQRNGRILAEGHFFNNSGGNSMYKFSGVLRLNTNGSTDPTFTPGTLANGYFHYDGGSYILPLPQGKALIGGVYGSYNSTPAWSLVRIFAGQTSNPSLNLLLLQ